MDAERAIQALEDYLAILQRGLSIVLRVGSDNYVRDPELQRVSTDLNERVLLVERIIGEIDEILLVQFRNHPSVGWSRASEIVSVEKALGLLQRRDVEEVIFGLTGPKLAATCLHRWIWGAAANLWDDGHFASAVSASSVALFDEYLPSKLGILKSGSATDRITQAFSISGPGPDNPRLRLPNFVQGTDDWKSAHEGAMNFGRGCSLAIRNLAAHRTVLDEPQALESLAALSLLARWIDAARVDRVS